MKTTAKLLAVGGLSIGIVAAPLVAANAAETTPTTPLIGSVVSEGVPSPLGAQGRALTAQIGTGSATIGGTVAAGTDAVSLRSSDGRSLCTDTSPVRSGGALRFSCDVTVPLGVTQIDAIATDGGQRTTGERPLLLTSTSSGSSTPGVGTTPGLQVLLADGNRSIVLVTGAAGGRYTLTGSNGAVYQGVLDGNGEDDLTLPADTYTVTVDSSRQGGGVATSTVTIPGAAAPAAASSPRSAASAAASKHETSTAVIAEQYQGAALVQFAGERLVTVSGTATNGQSLSAFTGATGTTTKQVPSGSWTFTFYDFEGHPEDGAPVVVHLDIPTR